MTPCQKLGGCGRLLHALTPPRSAFLYLQFLARCHPYILLHFYTCIIYKKALQGRVESMQQSSATPKNKDVGRGLRKIVACSQPYLAVLSCIYSFWHGVIPTSYFIFNDFYTCFTHFFHGKGHPGLNCMRMRMWYVQRKLWRSHIYVRTYMRARSNRKLWRRIWRPASSSSSSSLNDLQLN